MRLPPTSVIISPPDDATGDGVRDVDNRTLIVASPASCGPRPLGRAGALADDATLVHAAIAAVQELYNEVSATNADFKKVLDAMLAFRNDEYLWWQVAELTYDSYLVRNRTRT